MPVQKAKCHCGQTEWTADLDNASHILCHCNACKIIGGSAFTLNQLVPKDKFNLTKGEVKCYTYKGDSGNPVHCYYCPNCTTHVYHHQTVAGDVYVVRTSIFEGSEKWDSTFEIYTGEKYHWQPLVTPEGAHVEGAPPS
ncbi:hypothetical protein FQN54_005520 [Arachnomyces sp. PD_36]|nr:hypothetical protein FQN54_005520 [Arachnomyces sp. PD_36]